MTAPVNDRRAQAEDIIARFYARIGKPRPGFLWFDDPLSCVLAHTLMVYLRHHPLWDWARVRPIRFNEPAGGQIAPELWRQLDAQLQASMDVSRTPPAEAPLECHGVWPRHHRTLIDRFWERFWSQLAALWGSELVCELRHSARDPVRELQPKDFRARFVNGPHMLWFARGFWGGETRAPAQDGARPGTPAARLNTLQRACGWWSPFETLVLCADRPHRIRTLDGSRLHCEDGSALELSAEVKVYAWRGTAVPSRWVVDRRALDPELALGWRNGEQRRAAAEIVGWERVLQQVETIPIDADFDPQVGALVQCWLPFDGRCRFLRVQCGTGRRFALRVPLTMRTAREANAWTYGLREDEYQPEART